MKIKNIENRTKENFIWTIVETLLLIVSITGNLVLIPSNIKSILLYAMIICGVFAILQKGKIKTNSLNNYFYVYCFFSVLSLIFSPYFQGTLILSLGQFVLITVILINIPAQRVEVVLGKYIRALSVLVYLGIAYSFILKTFGEYMQYEGRRINYLFTPMIRQQTNGASWEIGYCAFWDNPNVFGFGVLIIFIYKLCERGEKNSKKIINLLYLFMGCILANSRGVYVCLVLSIVVYVYFNMKSESKILSVFLMLVILFGVLATGVINTWVANVDLTGRNEMWARMGDAIIKYPILGVGFSVTSKFILSDVFGRVVGSHNSYLNVLAENGIIGFLILIAIIVNVVYYIFCVQKKMADSVSNEGYNWITFACVLFVVFLAYGMIENAFMIVGSRNYLWMILCIYIYNYGRVKLLERSRYKH